MQLAEKEFKGLRSTMAKYGHTQIELAELLGVSQTYICNRFHKRSRWTLDDMKKISEFYGITMDELFK
jgi:antitoxin component HigA of HigAB toxin-antitoxin module